MKKSLLILAMALTSLFAFAQKQVSGTVTLQDTGEPEPGINVVVTGSTTGTITDMDGNYTITVPAGKSLTFSYIGYTTQVITPSGNVADVTLVPDATELEEVVAIGYGTMKKSDVTGSISSVKSADLQKTPASGIDQALQGKAAGVTINTGSGQPGAGAEVRIRGIGSINSDASPIYVVDGVITKDISFLSPNDITSMEVLKDASSTAIYGAQAANGVILVTTKTGAGADRPAKIQFNAYWGWQNRWKKLDLMNAQDHMRMRAIMSGDDEQILQGVELGDINAYWNTINTMSRYYPVGLDRSTVDTDWQDEVFKKNAFVHNYHLSIDGASDKGSYLFSASYFNQDGTIKGSNYDRLTLRLNTDFKVRKWLKIGENLSFSASSGRNAMNNSSSAGASVISAALAMAPWDPTHYAEGSKNNLGEDISGHPAAGSNFTNVTNPFSMIEYSEPINKTERWVGDMFIEIQPVKGLTIRPSLSMDLSNVRNRSFKYKYDFSSYDNNQNNYLSTSMTRYFTLTNDNVITYARDIKKHSFSVMAGESMQQYDYYNLGAAGAGILNEDPTNWYLNKTTIDSVKTCGDGVDRQRRLSFFGRVHYAYDSRYLVTVNFRADASSKFKKSDASIWGYFPSASLAWRINQEGFLKDNTNVDQLKLRFGWGQIGNDQVGENAFTQTIDSPGPYWVGWACGQDQKWVPGAAVLSLANENGRWETSESWNLGLDFGFLQGKISGSLEGYIRDTKDAILSVKGPAQVGNKWDPNRNIGIIRNMGVELTLGHENSVANGKFNYSINANLSVAKNEIIAMNGGAPVWKDRTKSDQGMAVRSFWGYVYEGVYRTDEEANAAMWATKPGTFAAGDAKYKDLNNDGKIDDADNTVIGNPFPWLNGSLSFNCDFYGVDMQIFFQGVYGNQIYNALRERTEGTGANNTLASNMTDVFVNYNSDKRALLESAGIDWADYMNQYQGNIPNPYGNSLNSANSSRFIEDGSYLRLKNVTIGYTIPKKYTQKAHINRLRLYVTGNNLLTFTKYSGYDPEVGGGVDYGNYPQSRTFMFGINLDF